MGEDQGMQISTPDPASYGDDARAPARPAAPVGAGGGGRLCSGRRTSGSTATSGQRTSTASSPAGASPRARRTFPPDWAILSVTVAAAHEGRGVGTALRAEVTTTLPDTAATLAGLVDDLDERSLAVAQALGLRGRAARHQVADGPGRPPRAGASGRRDDRERHRARVPGRRRGRRDARRQPDQPRGGAERHRLQVGGLADRAGRARAPVRRARPRRRRSGRDHHRRDQGRTSCSSTTPAWARHSAAATSASCSSRRPTSRQPAAGATRSYTTNEASNAGIRHVNAKLGYQVVAGDYRIRRAR